MPFEVREPEHAQVRVRQQLRENRQAQRHTRVARSDSYGLMLREPAIAVHAACAEKPGHKKAQGIIISSHRGRHRHGLPLRGTGGRGRFFFLFLVLKLFPATSSNWTYIPPPDTFPGFCITTQFELVTKQTEPALGLRLHQSNSELVWIVVKYMLQLISQNNLALRENKVET